jgi:hypothetical protein
MTTGRSFTAQRPGTCHVCGGHIRRGQPCAIAPFRHQTCNAWRPEEVADLQRIGAIAAPADPARPTVSRFVTVVDRAEIDKRLAALSAELLRADAKCDGIVRFNPDHFDMTHYQCVERRDQIESEIVYWRNQADLAPPGSEPRARSWITDRRAGEPA